jgi:hypothetical protein
VTATVVSAGGRLFVTPRFDLIQQSSPARFSLKIARFMKSCMVARCSGFGPSCFALIYYFGPTVRRSGHWLRPATLAGWVFGFRSP